MEFKEHMHYRNDDDCIHINRTIVEFKGSSRNNGGVSNSILIEL